MKKFKYSLDAVLKWKRSQEEASLRVLGEAMRARQLAFDTLQAGRRHMGELLKTVRDAREIPSQNWAQLQVVYGREIVRQQGVCKGYEESLKKAVFEEERARDAYLIKRKEAETIEKLGEKRKFLHNQQINRAIEQELEEIVLSKR